jgi:hypothetical protein
VLTACLIAFAALALAESVAWRVLNDRRQGGTKAQRIPVAARPGSR